MRANQCEEHSAPADGVANEIAEGCSERNRIHILEDAFPTKLVLQPVVNATGYVRSIRSPVSNKNRVRGRVRVGLPIRLSGGSRTLSKVSMRLPACTGWLH